MSCRTKGQVSFAVLLSAYTHAALAVGIGDITVESSLGKPLRAYAALIGGSDDIPDISCISLAHKAKSADQDIPRLLNAQLSLVKTNGKTRVAITTSGPVNEPALIIPLHIGCNDDVTKEYTVLLDPAEYAPSLPVAPPKAAPPSAATPAAQAPHGLNEWEIHEGESLRSMAKNIYPRNHRMRRAFIKAVRQGNPELAQTRDSEPLQPGALLKIPDLRALAATAVPDVPKPAAARSVKKPESETGKSATQSAQPKPARKAEAKKAEAPRLQIVATPPALLQGGAKAGDTAKLNPQQQNQALLAQADDQVALIMSQKNRIASLEGQLTAMQGQLAAMQKQMESLRQTTASASAKGMAANAPKPPAQDALIPPFWWGVISTAAMLGLAMALHYAAQRRRQEPVYGYELSSFEEKNSAEAPATSVPGKLAEASMHAMGASPLASMTVGEINSVVEEADVYFSLGRPDEAIKLLKDYIAFNPQLGGHPESKAKPWIKLLEIYRATHSRGEFEELATRYHQRFNVVKPVWSTTKENRATGNLEQFPHLIGLITATWNTPACLRHLQELISDNRDGNRTGFSAEVFDDMLMLVGVLNQLAETAQK